MSHSVPFHHHLLIFLLLLIFQYSVRSQDLTQNAICVQRCVAHCISTGSRLRLVDCQETCSSYDEANLCSDKKCWNECKDLGPPIQPSTPIDIHADKNNTNTVYWTAVPGATLYSVQFKAPSENVFNNQEYMMTLNASLDNFQNPTGSFCDAVDVRVASVSPGGVSAYGKTKKMDSPQPLVSPKLTLKEMSYIDRPFVSDFYQANGTIKLVFQYQPIAWPLGDVDLLAEPMFHMINCIDADLSQSVPLPEFEAGPSNTLIGYLGADMMYRKCRFVYYVQSISSKQCKTTTFIHQPPPDSLQTLNIDCDTVSGNPCVKVERHEAPVCGQIEDIQYWIMNEKIRAGDKDFNATLNVTFDPIVRYNEPDTIYYVAFFGPASNYKTKEEETFLGVNVTAIIGNVTNCYNFTSDGHCAHPTNNTVFVSGILFDQLYGITFCAVKDPRNLTFPDFTMGARSLRPKANKILINSKDYRRNNVGIIIGVTLGSVALLVLVVLFLCCYVNKKQQKKNEKFRLKITQLQLEKDMRYTEFPKKHDIWEIERRNLIIHNDRKLGSGAFGAVYLGKLLGKSLGHKDANSPLGINLMRAENCEVAVKMLPEYADELSKSEFLREIGLMKTLGYHERLVNMLACVTDSEPLCLVVEYCSDGDLLHFLKDRCKYMMKLDELGVNYQEPPVNDNYDIDMIITMKQLLMYAVQVCYGLEYMSQKGFVHRDVAARNILVDQRNSCKIGDFGLCRYIYADAAHYKSKGGRLPLKWMSPEAIRHYEFSTASDVWSFGILLFEIITLGGSPYPGVQPEDMLPMLERGERMEQPDNCPDTYYSVMSECWEGEPEARPDFAALRQRLAGQLEDVTEEYSYLKLDAQRDYYNVQYGDQKPDVIVIPETESLGVGEQKNSTSSSTLSIDSIPQDSIIMDPNEDIDRTKAAIRDQTTKINEENLCNESLSISMTAADESVV